MVVLAQTPTYQDCLGALKVCDDEITVNFNHNGMGNYTNEIVGVSGCYAPEQRSVWLEFTIQQGGILRFEINPVSQNQDHDWTLFDLTNGTCAQLSTFAGAAAAMVRSNTWGVFGNNGSTGVSTPNGGFGNCNGPGNFNGPKWCADLNVATGETFLLHITNWTGSAYGFTVDFSSSTAVLFDNIPPAIDSISSPVNCQSFDSVAVVFDEPVVCSSLQTGDFELVGPSGNHTITAVNGLNCTNTTDEVSISFTPAVTQVGNYTLKIKPGAGYVEDLCGNLDTLDSISFYFDGIIDAALSAVHLDCFNECIGEIDVDVFGGDAPYTFNWTNSLPNDSNQTGLCAGQYTVTVEDNLGCEVTKSITINEPSDISTITNSTTKVSCPNTSNCDGGAIVSAAGGVAPYTYDWSSNETGPSASQLCVGVNTVYITDNNGCLDTHYINIDVPDSIVTVGYGDTMICIGSQASIAASSTGGTPPFSYIWHIDSLDGPVVSTNQVFSVNPDSTTSYFVESFDDRGCVGDTSMVLVEVRPPLGLEFEEPDTICPYDTIPLEVVGTGGDSTYTYSWSTGHFGSMIYVSPDEPTTYVVTVSDGCGTPAYKDSLFVQVGGYSKISADIKVEDDSVCVGESVYLIANGRGGFRGPDEYRYNWKHTSSDNPIQFVNPKVTTTYTLTISDLCLSEIGKVTKTVYVGKPETPELTSSIDEACGEALVLLTNETFKNKSSYDWIFKDQTYENYSSDTMYREFSEVGCHGATIEVTNEFGCTEEATFPCLINILEQPEASFTFDPLQPTNVSPYVTVINTSEGYDELMWIMELDTIYNEEEVKRFFDLRDTTKTISLYLTNEHGCYDTLTKKLPLLYETLLYYPSSFTPNGDGMNDVFRISGEAISIEDFSLIIYDRWGRQLFRSNNPERGWDGHFVNGELVPMGEYPFVLRYRDHLGELRVVRDHITIIKTGKNVGLK